MPRSEEAPTSDVLYTVQTGAYSVKANADAQLAKVKIAGFDTFNTTKSGTSATATPTKKSSAEIVKEIYNGACSDPRWSTWGNGVDRLVYDSNLES